VVSGPRRSLRPDGRTGIRRTETPSASPGAPTAAAPGEPHASRGTVIGSPQRSATRLIALFAATLVSCSLGLLVVGSAAAVPKPSPRFWSAARCERVLPKEHPGIRQIICVGSGGPSSCRWTSGHRVRLYSQLRVRVVSPRELHDPRDDRSRAWCCSLVHARHTRPPRLRPHRPSLRRRMGRLAGRLLHGIRPTPRHPRQQACLRSVRRDEGGRAQRPRANHQLYGRLAARGDAVVALMS